MPTNKTELSIFKQCFLEKDSRIKVYYFVKVLYSEKYEKILEQLYKNAFLEILKLSGRSFVEIRKRLYDLKTIKGLNQHDINSIFTSGEIWEIPTKEICEFIKSCMEETHSVNIHFCNGSPENESITLLYALIRCGIFGKTIPHMKCFDNGDELHPYSNYILTYLAAYESGVFKDEMDEIDSQLISETHITSVSLLPKILVKPQNLIKGDIRKTLPPDLAIYKSLMVCLYPNDTYFPKLIDCLKNNYETYNGVLFICDSIAGLNLPKDFNLALYKVGYTFIKLGDQPTVA